MTYATTESALVTVLQGVGGIGADRVTKGDWRVLGYGRTPCIVITYGGFEAQEAAMFSGADEHVTWAFMLNLCVRYIDDAQVHAGAVVLRDAVMQRIRAYPELSNASGVIEARIVSGVPFRQEAPQYPLLPFGQHKYYIEHLACRVEERMTSASEE